jgi:8-amino-3,8-dideoxy-alpha-D-manno-octulosonate transaminase
VYKFDQEEKEAIWRVIESGWLFRYGGQEANLHQVDQFEQQFAARMHVPHAVAVTSGTAALICALAGLGIGPGDEVIIPGYTFIATAAAVVDARAVPVIAEIDETLTIDPEDVRAKITPRTRAIIPVHMAGIPANLGPILDLAAEHDLHVIEDACQAVGGSYHAQPLGSLGDVGAFSLNFYKIIGVGEGGIAVTRDRIVHERMRMHHDTGVSFWGADIPADVPCIPGVNYRMNELLGAFALVQLKRLDGFVANMRAIKQRIYGAVEGTPRPAPQNDPDGDCGTNVHFQFSSAEEASLFERLLGEQGVSASRPINTGRHVYSNWEFIMSKTNICDPGCAWDCPHYASHVEYAPDMCPNTLDILARTVTVGVSPFWEPDQVNVLTDHLVEAAACL